MQIIKRGVSLIKIESRRNKQFDGLRTPPFPPAYVLRVISG